MVQGLVDAIGRRESAGQKDPYRAKGVPNKKGQRAYGKYQVMDFNIPTWTKEILGRPYTVEEFLNDPAAQDKVAQTRLAQYKQKTGSDADAASMWFSGQPQAKAGNAADPLGTTTNQYVSDIMGTMNGATLTKATPQRNAISGGGIQSQGLSREQKIKNINSMERQGATQEEIQGYLDSLKGGSQSPKSSGGDYFPDPPKETPFVPNKEGLNDNRKISEKITDTPGLHSTVDALGTNFANMAFAGKGLLDVPSAMFGNKDAQQRLHANAQATQEIPQTNPIDNAKAGVGLSAAVLGPKVGGAGATKAQGLVSPLIKSAVGKGAAYLGRHPVQKWLLEKGIEGTGLLGAYKLLGGFKD